MQLHSTRSFQFPLRGYLVISISCFLLAVTARMAMAVIDSTARLRFG
jgi:hypothetical protein